MQEHDNCCCWWFTLELLRLMDADEQGVKPLLPLHIFLNDDLSLTGTTRIQRFSKSKRLRCCHTRAYRIDCAFPSPLETGDRADGVTTKPKDHLGAWED
ncbi:hypothetical protein P8452_44109 [Trifolium repens]|nr:hypothetical protein P8452_44109 [Trifolium repens]